MAEHAEVFISATTRDLGSFRREIKDALLTLQIFPIEQTNFRLAHGPLTAKLRYLIAPCDAVIHLAGGSLIQVAFSRTIILFYGPVFLAVLLLEFLLPQKAR